MIYRMAATSELPEIQGFLSRNLQSGETYPALETSDLVIARDESNGKLAAVLFISTIVRVGPFCVSTASRGGKVSFGAMVAEADNHLAHSLSMAGLERLPYITFQPDASREAKMKALGYTPLNWTPYVKVVEGRS